ncbi:MAG: hypothetical protein QXS54_09210, partial [Candidatus Methanomethylicaceae archaeon]
MMLAFAGILIAVPDGKPKTFTERLPGTTVQFEMVEIPPGTIEMPDPENPEKSITVQIKRIWIGKTEVTWDEYGTYAFNREIEQIEKQHG